MDGLKVEIITRDFGRMLESLASIDPTVEFKTVVDEIAARVAYRAMSLTVSAKAGDIRARWEGQEVTTFNGKVVRLDWRFPSTQWAALKEQRQKSLNNRLAARGTAKQSWLGFTRGIKKTIEAPAYVVSANYKGHTHETDSQAREQGSNRGYMLTLIQNSPLIIGGRMERALFSAMAGQTRRFETLMEVRAFRTLASRAEAYPGIFLRGPSGV